MEAAEQVRERYLELTDFEDGMIGIRGLLDNLGGAALRTALEPLARKTDAGDQRSRPRCMADALVELAHHALNAGNLPTRNGQRPHLQVTCTLETLMGAVGAPAADLEFGRPISAETLRRIACDSTVSRVLLDPGSVILDLGHKRRAVSGSQRRAIDLRDRHCQWPGCDRDASWCDSHHVVFWTRRGKTNRTNIILLCHRHHWQVHEGGWQLALKPNREVVVLPPRFYVTREPCTAAA